MQDLKERGGSGGNAKGSPKKGKTNKNCGHRSQVDGCSSSIYGWAARPLG